MSLRSSYVTPLSSLKVPDEASCLQNFDCPKCGLFSPWANELLSLREQVITDPLTGLFNIRYFRSALEMEIERTARTAIPTSLMMIDLDHFKQVNDVWGHEVGNQVLKLTARLIKQETRQLDIQCRYGGEEFVVILPSTSLLLASQVADRLRQRIEKSEIVTGDQTFNVTASIGLSVRLSHEHGGVSDLIKAADNCLYQAKSLGRNQVFYPSVEREEAVVSGDEKTALMGMFSDYQD
ncbi:MAG: two-component system cell cycle response regulator [Oleispira sp.]|jgi:two-component system cell cycle response regulator